MFDICITFFTKMTGRMDKYLFIKCFSFFILISNIGFSTPTDSLKFKIKVLPSAFYTPETSLGLGALVYTYFKFNKNNNRLLRKSNTQSYIDYTLNKQFTFENDYQLWLKENQIYLTGAANFSRFPEYYYGIGNDTKENDRIITSFDLIMIQSKNLFQLNNNLYGGLYFHYQNLATNENVSVHHTSCSDAFGKMGYEAKGIGPILIYDTRDNPLNPSNGAYVETSYMDYKNIINNNNMFVSFVLDARKYYTILKKIVWNGNFYFSYNKGEVPYRMLPEIGGARFLRGYYRGRFRDNNMIVVQQEFRMPVYKMIGIAVFGGVGEVSKTVSDLKLNEMHYNYGIGLRIRINKKENTNLRIDYGFTKDSQGLYVVFAEAF